MKKSNEMNTVKISTLDEIQVAPETLYDYNGLQLNVQKSKRDINGNPRYALKVFKDGQNITEKYRGALGRYTKKGHIIFQSYQLSNAINFILSKNN